MKSELARATELLASCSSAEEFFLKCAVCKADPHEMFKCVADGAKAAHAYSNSYSNGLADDIDCLTIEEYFRGIKSGSALSAACRVHAYAEKIVFLDMLCKGAMQLFSSPASYQQDNGH